MSDGGRALGDGRAISESAGTEPEPAGVEPGDASAPPAPASADAEPAPTSADAPASPAQAPVDEVAPDGSPLAFYLALEPAGEPELIDAVLGRPSTILDLGCGPGRIAGPLAARGHRVTGVDDAAAMLRSLPPGVEGVLADAREVRLERRFDAVLLASHLLNDPDDGWRFARTAAAHLAPDGVAIGEVYPPGWDPTAGLGREGRLGRATFTMVRATLDGDRLDAEMRYTADGREWHQPFVARLLDEAALREVLAAGGLVFERWLERPGWLLARPA